MHLHHSSRASSSAPIAPRPHRSAIKLSELVVTIALRRALANFWPRVLYQGGLGDPAPVVRRVCFFCHVRCARWGFPRGADPGQVPQTLSGHAVPNRTSLLLYIILYGAGVFERIFPESHGRVKLNHGFFRTGGQCWLRARTVNSLRLFSVRHGLRRIHSQSCFPYLRLTGEFRLSCYQSIRNSCTVGAHC